jgi:hypothetical protein
MRRALDLAAVAAEAGEVPVGAVITLDGEIVAEARNSMRGNLDPTAHAEMVAIRHAATRLGRSRLDGCTLWVPSLARSPPCCSGGGPEPNQGTMRCLTKGDPMSRHLPFLFAAALLASCGQSENPAPPVQNEIMVRSEAQQQLFNLGDLDRAIALKRAILDQGLRCARVVSTGYVTRYKDLEVWTATCDEDRTSVV